MDASLDGDSYEERRIGRLEDQAVPSSSGLLLNVNCPNHKEVLMQALVLAAGRGTRLRRRVPKPLVKVCGRTLLGHCLRNLADLGIREFVVVVGHKAERVRTFVSDHRAAFPKGKIVWVYNKAYMRGNGVSVLCAQKYLDGPFLLSMVDHLYDPAMLRGLLSRKGTLITVVDSDPRFVDPEEATKVLMHRGQILRIGKQLQRYNALDCGVFLCSKQIFPVLREAVTQGHDEWNHAKQRLARRHRAEVYDVRGGFWFDVDTPEEVRRAEQLLRQRLRDTVTLVLPAGLEKSRSIPSSEPQHKGLLSSDQPEISASG